MRGKKGAVLIFTFIIMVTLTVIAVFFLFMTSKGLKAAAYDLQGSKALWLAEAGLEKAFWNLKTPAGSGGQGENWTTAGTTESLGDGNYKMVVTRWDFALAANGGSASDDPVQPSPAFSAPKAIDGDDSTHWRSPNRPTAANPQSIIITFPYVLNLNKVRFLSTNTQSQPKDYTWEVSADGMSYTIVVTKSGNADIDVTDEFIAVSNAKFLKLKVTKAGLDAPQTRVRIATLEAIGSKITSTGTVDAINRKIEQTVIADDPTQTASEQADWNEIVPAN